MYSPVHVYVAMAQERALTCPASFDLHRHCSWANLLAALMSVHRLWGERGGHSEYWFCLYNILTLCDSTALKFQTLSVENFQVLLSPVYIQTHLQTHSINQQDHLYIYKVWVFLRGAMRSVQTCSSLLLTDDIHLSAYSVTYDWWWSDWLPWQNLWSTSPQWGASSLQQTWTHYVKAITRDTL